MTDYTIGKDGFASSRQRRNGSINSGRNRSEPSGRELTRNIRVADTSLDDQGLSLSDNPIQLVLSENRFVEQGCSVQHCACMNLLSSSFLLALWHTRDEVPGFRLLLVHRNTRHKHPSMDSGVLVHYACASSGSAGEGFRCHPSM